MASQSPESNLEVPALAPATRHPGPGNLNDIDRTFTVTVVEQEIIAIYIVIVTICKSLDQTGCFSIQLHASDIATTSKVQPKVIFHRRWHCELPLNLPAIVVLKHTGKRTNRGSRAQQKNVSISCDPWLNVALPQCAEQVGAACAFCSWAQSSICFKLSLLPSTATANCRFFTSPLHHLLRLTVYQLRVKPCSSSTLQRAETTGCVLVPDVDMSFRWQ